MGVPRQHCARTGLALLFLAITTSAIAHCHHLPIHQLGVVGKETTEETKRGNWWQMWERFLTRRRLVDAGSAPPTCDSKCGGCSPCDAVLVTIPPVWKILDYYPQVWRCKCGDQLFTP